MPQPRTPGRTTVSRNGGAPTSEVTPQEAAQIRSSVAAKEQAPSSRVQSVFGNWREIADQLGDPFERERIPLSKLRQMRRDPMLGFGLSFIKVPLIRANWYINAVSNDGPNPQVAAHADENLRRIFGSFVSQYMNSLDFGYQAVAKRFEFRIPGGTFVATDDSGTETEQPIWSEGGIQPIAWKPFVALRPEGCEPVWDKSTGEFFGIEYSPVGNATPGAGGAQTGGGAGGTNKAETFKIDLPHSLWITNEKDGNFGSIFGYPRLGYAYAYWWSYWFRWAIADRAFERKADPSVLVYHPDGEFINEDTGERMSYSEYALAIGDRMRSGGVIAVPSEVYEDATGRGTIRQWEIGFTKDAANFEPFDKSFEYIDVQKLRALFIPEQAFMEGKGGTSSRNVADTLGGAFVESQDVLARQVTDHINRWLLPQWLAVNYPEFQAAGGKAEVVMQGFASEDNDFMLQIVQLIGQQESGAQEIMKLTDLKKILADRGTPITSFAEQQRREQEIIAQQALTGPAAPPTGLPAAPGTSLLPTETVPTATTTGFSYVAPRERIELAESGTSFIENLPGSRHFEDITVKGFTRQLWNLWFQLYRDEYDSAAKAVQEAADVQLSAEDLSSSDEDLSLASRRTKRLLEDWRGSSRWDSAFTRTREILSAIMKRAGRLEVGRLRKQGKLSDASVDSWLDAHLPEMMAKAQETCRHEIESFLDAQLQDAAPPHVDQLASSLRSHFADFPNWKADRLARTEVSETYNAATLYAGEVIGATNAQAMDNLGDSPLTDAECRERDGKIFPISDAFKEREHPNGTLAWRILPAELSISYGEVEGAEFDEETASLTLAEDISTDTQKKIVADVVELMLR